MFYLASSVWILRPLWRLLWQRQPEASSASSEMEKFSSDNVAPRITVKAIDENHANTSSSKIFSKTTLNCFLSTWYYSSCQSCCVGEDGQKNFFSVFLVLFFVSQVCYHLTQKLINRKCTEKMKAMRRLLCNLL